MRRSWEESGRACTALPDDALSAGSRLALDRAGHEPVMLTILLIVLLVILLFGGGGYAYRGRRRL